LKEKRVKSYILKHSGVKANLNLKPKINKTASIAETWWSKVDIYFYVDVFY
jgi:hypothetical protein